MNVLIIGGNGYLGAAIAQACARAGAAVRILSRTAPVDGLGEWVPGDVQLPRLGLRGDRLDAVRTETTHVVSCFGTVDWTCGPDEALQVHAVGTRSVLTVLGELPSLQQALHVSSLLVLGRARGTVGNRELFVGQRFRNWYEYGKYTAEALVRESDLPIGVVRFGPILGPDPRGGRPDVRHGLPAVIPHLLAGHPVHLRHRGDFPCWVSDVTSAAQVALTALQTPIGRDTWTWFDPATPTLREVFERICRPWGRVPRIIDAPMLATLTRMLDRRLGVPRELVDYDEPWFDLATTVLDQVPRPWPVVEPDYLTQMGRDLLGAVPGRYSIAGAP